MKIINTQTKNMKKALLFLCCILYVLHLNSQVTGVDYRLDYDESNCMFNAYLIINSGSGTTPIQLVQGSSAWVLTTPKEITIDNITSINPTNDTWDISITYLEPANSPNFNYYQILADQNPAKFYNPLTAGDEILLFSAEASHDMHGSNGVKAMDYFSTITNNFKLGVSGDLLENIQAQGAPAIYAELDPIDLYIGITDIVSPATGGTWTNSDPLIASLVGNDVTGLTAGSTILTFTPTNGDCPSSTVVRVSQNSVISDVDYKIVFNEVEGVYDCNIVVNTGAAISSIERIQFGSTFSIVVPLSATLKDLNSIAPSSTMWTLVDSVVAPITDPLHKFYQISTDGLPVTMHDVILTGDEVTLFKIELDYDFHSQVGIRNLTNGSDLIGNPFSMNNDFNVGAINLAYNNNLPVVFPSVFAELTGNSTILTGETVTINPLGGGIYSINDPSIISIDASNVITGLAPGTAIITYTPTIGSSSDVEMIVEATSVLSSVNYMIEFDEGTCLYNCYLVAQSGNALTMAERLAGSGSFSIAVPKDVNLTFDTSISPSSTAWTLGGIILAPMEDPTRNFYQITTIPSTAEYYDQIFEGDQVLLFKVALDENTQGPDGIRNYINGTDPTGNGFSIDNDFNIGGLSSIYNTNETPIFPAIYATASSNSIDIGTTTTVSPTTGGTWSTNSSTAATFDATTFTITGQDEGTILLTFTPADGNVCPSSVVVTIENPVHDPVTEVDYQIKFNETTCNYDCYLKVITGSALTPIERFQFSSSFTVVTAAETSLQFVGSVAPSSTAWQLNQSELAPSEDTAHNFYHFITLGSTNNVHNFLYPGDEVLLFSVELNDNIQGVSDGIRVFDNIVDPPNVSVSMQNEFNIGNIVDRFRQNITTTFPSVYAEAPTGTEINTGQTVDLVPPSSGTWANSNTTVSQIDGNTVTGYADGHSIYTFTPTNGDCPSSVVIHVSTLPHDQISEVDYKIRFNSTTCNYEALMIVKTGSAITQAERLAFASNYTIVTPPEITITLVESVTPGSNYWTAGIVENSPATDPEKNFFQFLSGTGQVLFYDFLYEHDETVLFTFDADYDIHYSGEIRNFINGTDNPSVSLQNEFNIGSPIDVYSANISSDLPSTFADTTNTSEIFVGMSTIVSSPVAGSWTSSDINIATIDVNNGKVDGVAIGSAVMTLTPTDNTICPSSVIIDVIAHESLSEVEYVLIWDEVNMEYIASMIAVKGNAISTAERTSLASTFSIVAPSLVTPTISSTSPNAAAWSMGDVITEPTSDPLHNFYQILNDGLPVAQYDIILEGDIVELFRISMDINVHGNNGLRILENGVDLVGNPLSIDNDINIGGVSSQYQQNATTVLPVIHAETNTAYEIATTETTNVLPIIGGTWANSNPAVAILDANGLVTGLIVGTTVLTFTPNNGDTPSSVIIYVSGNQNSNVTKVDFKIEFDDTTCDTYNCYMIIKEGAAYSPANLIQFSSTYTIVAPKDITITFDESIAPNATTWSNGDQALSPAEDPLHNFFSFYPLFSGSNMYDALAENDEVLLFKVTASSLAHGPKGIRLFNNSMDLLTSSLSFKNGITIGNVNQLYNDNQEGTSPSNYAEATGAADIIIDGQTSIIPTTGGIWTNNNPSVAVADVENIVTGLSLGTAVFTFTPNDPATCPSTFSVNVVESAPSIAVAIGTTNPAPSSLLDVYSTEKGILIPRMSQAQRLCIASPPDGLLVFQLNQNTGFYYFNGASWTRLDDTITNGTSNAQSGNTNTSSLQSNNEQLIQMLLSQQADLEKKLKKQDALILELNKVIKNQ